MKKRGILHHLHRQYSMFNLTPNVKSFPLRTLIAKGAEERGSAILVYELQVERISVAGIIC